jgi:hypothetical protein
LEEQLFKKNLAFQLTLNKGKKAQHAQKRISPFFVGE